MIRSHESTVRVRYAETDQLGVGYHSNSLIWLEVGRVELCRALGFSYTDMEREDGLLLAVVEVNCRYLHPARYDDEVIVKAWVEKATTRGVRFGYEMRRAGDGRKLSTATTRHIFCGRDMRPMRLPEKYFRLFGVKRER